MYKEFYTIGIIISLGLSLLMLYKRKEKWFSEKRTIIWIIGATLTSILGLILSNNNHFRFLFYYLIVPPLFFIMDRLFKYLSFKIHDRDFYLYLQGSKEINDTLSGLGKNKHIKASDIIFSFSLLILIIGLTIFGAVLFGKNDLYHKWF